MFCYWYWTTTDVPMSEEAAEDADFTERLKLALDFFVMPEAIRKYRSATVQRKYAFIKLCEDPA